MLTLNILLTSTFWIWFIGIFVVCIMLLKIDYKKGFSITIFDIIIYFLLSVIWPIVLIETIKHPKIDKIVNIIKKMMNYEILKSKNS